MFRISVWWLAAQISASRAASSSLTTAKECLKWSVSLKTLLSAASLSLTARLWESTIFEVSLSQSFSASKALHDASWSLVTWDRHLFTWSTSPLNQERDSLKIRISWSWFTKSSLQSLLSFSFPINNPFKLSTCAHDCLIWLSMTLIESSYYEWWAF